LCCLGEIGALVVYWGGWVDLASCILDLVSGWVGGAGYTVPMTRKKEDPATCPMCDGSGWFLTEEDGVELVRRCECAEGAVRERYLSQAQIPARYRECTLEGFEIWDPKNGTTKLARHAVQEFVDLYPNVEKGLLLMGPVGSGKTHLAVAALSQIISEKRPPVRGRFVDFTSLVLEIQMTFDGSGSSRDILRPLIGADLLVLDELGAGKTTPWVMDLLYYLVNTRYQQGRTTVFTTNYVDRSETSPDDREYLADRVSRRIRSRLFEMCRKVELRGGDYRKRRFGDQIYERHA